MLDDKFFLDYDGLKKLVQCVLDEIPKVDGVTIIQNEDGTISSMGASAPTVDIESETMILSTPGIFVNSGTETLVYN